CSAACASGSGSGATSARGCGSGVTSVAGTGVGSALASRTGSLSGSGIGAGSGSDFAAAALSTGCGRGCGDGAFSRSAVLSPTLRASSTISGRSVGFGAGVSDAGALRSPRMICVYSLIDTMSTGSDSTSATSKDFGADRETIPNPRAATCRISDAERPFFMSGTVLLLQGRQPEITEACRRDPRHHPHDGAVIGGTVTANI